MNKRNQNKTSLYCEQVLNIAEFIKGDEHFALSHSEFLTCVRVFRNDFLTGFVTLFGQEIVQECSLLYVM